jgi:hypothetical protein
MVADCSRQHINAVEYKHLLGDSKQVERLQRGGSTHAALARARRATDAAIFVCRLLRFSPP